VIAPAARYAPAPDLSIVACYFNPSGYRTKRENYERFAESLRVSGIELLTVECAFPGTGFELEASGPLLQIQARDVMWQKERLLNLALAALPADWRKVAWLDCDVLFENPEWARETSRLLERQAVVQPFSAAIRLPRGTERYRGEGQVWDGFAAVQGRDPRTLLSGRFDRHGHTGFAWAATREVLSGVGFFDACIAGSGDHMMAHAFCGDWESPCIDRIVGPASERNHHRRAFADWGRRVYPAVRARVGSVPGTLLHLWHGDHGHRRYVDRNQQLGRFEFDPAEDVRVGASGCWEWASDKPQLHAWAVEYFRQRREDGDAAPMVRELDWRSA